MPPYSNFRLNGTIVPMIFIKREWVNGNLTGRRHVAAWIDGVGRFPIDDNEQLRGARARRFNKIATAVSSPEKAGVDHAPRCHPTDD